MLAAQHWGRLLEGDLFVSSSSTRIEWPVLLQRTHGLDALACPMCHDPLRPIATITDSAAIRAILTLDGRPPDRAPISGRSSPEGGASPG